MAACGRAAYLSTAPLLLDVHNLLDLHNLPLRSFCHSGHRGPPITYQIFPQMCVMHRKVCWYYLSTMMIKTDVPPGLPPESTGLGHKGPPPVVSCYPDGITLMRAFVWAQYPTPGAEFWLHGDVIQALNFDAPPLLSSPPPP